MSIFKEKQQRDDMHALTRNGAHVDPKTIEGKQMRRQDRAHIFQSDLGGEIVAKSLLDSVQGRRIGAFRSRTLRLGVNHSHDVHHRDHYLEIQHNPPRDLLQKFRNAVKVFRRNRKRNLDQ